MMSQSHSHADLHKVGSQRLEHELSPIGLGLHVSGEEEEGGAVGGGGGIMLGAIEQDKLSESNGVISELHQDSYDEHREKKDLPLAPETVSVMVTSRGDKGETELVEMAQFKDEKTAIERTHQVDNYQGLTPHLDEQHKDSTTCFQGDVAPPTAVVNFSPSNGVGGSLMKTGLATPHMIRSTVWDPAAADEKHAQVTYQTSIQEGSQSPQTDSHFLEDFID